MRAICAPVTEAAAARTLMFAGLAPLHRLGVDSGGRRVEELDHHLDAAVVGHRRTLEAGDLGRVRGYLDLGLRQRLQLPRARGLWQRGPRRPAAPDSRLAFRGGSYHRRRDQGEQQNAPSRTPTSSIKHGLLLLLKCHEARGLGISRGAPPGAIRYAPLPVHARMRSCRFS